MKRHTERGFTLVEIMIVVAIIALLAAIAIPNVLRGRATANESAAIGNIRALVSSQEMYRSVNNTYPTVAGGWQAAMFPAGAPAYAPPSFNNPMDGTAAAQVQGYIYTYADGVTPGQQYTLTALPSAPNQTGTRAFFVDDTAVIRHCNGVAGGGAATVASLTIDQPLPAVVACP